MNALQTVVVLLVAVLATCVVTTREVRAQAIAVSAYGVVLALMFLLFEAPDVALSQITVGAVALPLMILLALARIRRDERSEK